jgi:hypothetical protein
MLHATPPDRRAHRNAQKNKDHDPPGPMRTFLPFWRRPDRLVFHANGAPHRMFCCGGGLRERSIPDPMLAVGYLGTRVYSSRLMRGNSVIEGMLSPELRRQAVLGPSA